MLYPPGPAPHISEFKRVLTEEFGCEFKHDRFDFGDGVIFDYTYIERDMGEERRMYPITDYQEDMMVHGLFLLSICRYFQLDCSRWGVTLRYLDDNPNETDSDALN